MGFVFDRLWPTSAAAEMRREFGDTLRNMGRFAEVIGDENRDLEGPQIAKLRETINTAFSNTHVNADSVKFEFGPERNTKLALRDNILRWVATARTLYLLQLSLGRALDYQSAVHPLPVSLVAARQAFCATAGATLEQLAKRVEGRARMTAPDLPGALGRLENAFTNWFAAHPEEHVTPSTSGILATARQFVTVEQGLELDMEAHAYGQVLVGS
jgi:hypothetical protein